MLTGERSDSSIAFAQSSAFAQPSKKSPDIKVAPVIKKRPHRGHGDARALI
jgi:hypothetical protein